MEHLRGRAAVNIVVVAEGLDHVLIARHVGQHAQFNLRIIGVHEHPAGARDEIAPQLAPQLRAHGNVLQIRLRGTDAAGARFGLVEAGMDAAIRADHLEQAVAVCGFELGKRAVIEYLLHGGVVVSQALEDFRICGIARLRLFAVRQAKLHKERITELLRRIDVELIADGCIDLRLQAIDLTLELLAVSADALAVHGKAFQLHVGQHTGKRHLDLV